MDTFDVIIVGAGLVGRFFALGLCRAGFKVASIDHESNDTILTAANDGRTTAITLGSKRFFDKLKLWDEISPYAQPIQTIRVFEKGSPWTIDYDAEDISSYPMGYIAENIYIRRSLFAHTPENLTVFSPDSIQEIKRTDAKATVTLTSGKILHSQLIIAADGRFSKIRSLTSICTKNIEYNQNALVVHMHHEKPHNDTAFEIFQPEGPLAILPLKSDHDLGFYKSGIVWCKPRHFDWSSFDDIALAEILYKEFDFFGRIEILPKRWIYPLSYTKVDSMIDNRIALIGDAAHVVHPIAGQGVNLGWRDAAVLIQELTDAKSQGIDLGCPFLLKRYDSKRKFDRLSVLWSTDLINHLYQFNFPPLYAARNSAFALLNRVKPLKKMIMKRAMGI